MPTLTGKIRLCKGIHLDRDYKNVMNYTENQMVALCESQDHLVASANDYSFIRNRGTISTNFSYDDCLKSNYIAFQNKDYSNKWFFAFIDDVIYVGENNTEIKYTVDIWSTWFGYWTQQPCFTIREHVDDDYVGYYTEVENLDVGDVIAENIINDKTISSIAGYYICICCNYVPEDNSTGNEVLPADRGTDYSGITIYNKNVFGTRLLLFYISQPISMLNPDRFIRRLAKDGKAESIENMFILPYSAFDANNLQYHEAYNDSTSYPFEFYIPNYTIDAMTWNTTITKKTSYNNLTIKNKKCFVFPYNYLLVSNNQGSQNIYKYEDFYSDDCVFTNNFSVSIGGSGHLIPKNYKQGNDTLNYDEAISFGKFPTCAWSSDAFTNWLTQNSINIAVSGLFGILGTLGGASFNKKTGDLSNGKQIGISTSSSLANTFAELNTALLMPNISGTQPTGDVAWSEDSNYITYKQMRCKDEFILKIDDYFTKYGYKVNRIKNANITGRVYWNYIEIGESEEIGSGDVPSKYMDEINNICRRGVTIWHNHANIGNYNLNNVVEV